MPDAYNWPDPPTSGQQPSAYSFDPTPATDVVVDEFYTDPGGVNSDSPDVPVPNYLGYGCQTAYGWDQGLAAQAVAASKGSQFVDFVRLHTGFCVKTITATATRPQRKPVVPSFDTQSVNDVLISKEVGTFSPPNLPDGTPVFGVVVRYTYVTQQYPGDNDNLDFGRQPIDPVQAGAYQLNPNDFTQFLTTPVSPVTNGPTQPVNW